jgi:hypothetical protein
VHFASSVFLGMIAAAAWMVLGYDELVALVASR